MAWTLASSRAALADRDLIGIVCHGQPVALYRLGDEVHATSDTCPHLGASLSAGCVVDGFIECPLHHALFDIRTGAADGSVTSRPVPTYPVKLDGDAIYIDLSGSEETAS
jgi:nitrite reductase/ring-hydroxylating ferredoxin subunit